MADENLADYWRERDAATTSQVIDERKRAMWAEAERDTLAARLAAAEKVVEDVKLARRHLRSALVAVTPLLDVPYIDMPQHTPWSRFVKPAMRALDAAVDAYRTHEPEPEQT